jgi:hypothetical protein
MKKRVTMCLMFVLTIFSAGTVWGLTETSSSNYFGINAGLNNTGHSNSFFGANAGMSNTDANSNSFFGLDAGRNNTGYSNSFFGAGSGQANTIGVRNTFIGTGAGMDNTTGSYNSFVGWNVGESNNTGSENNFFGHSAGASNTSGLANSFFGSYAGRYNTIGSQNSFFGNNAGYSNVTGWGNIFLGHNAGRYETGSNKLYISNSDTSTPLIYGEFDNQYLEINASVTVDDSVGIGTGTAPPQSALQVIGYVQLDLTTDSPPDVDCDAPLEYGRMKVDATNELLYICVGSGWMSVAGGPEPPPTCSDYNGDEATCIDNNCRWNKKKLTCN